MPTKTAILVISDLHLADGHSILDCFGDAQQSAFEGLLNATTTHGPLGMAEHIELVINGDCFDFLTTLPYETQGVADTQIATGKLERIIAAHTPFFAALGRFISAAGRHVTFLTGNHDIELAFAEVRDRITAAITGKAEHPAVTFCLARAYHPLPDVHIEHGNQFDFWNHVTGLWDAQGQLLNAHPETLQLPIGSRYFQQVAYQVSIAYPYFDHFEPSMNSTRQIALLCLLNPDVVIQTAQNTMKMLAEPHPALEHLSAGEERVPARLFDLVMRDFVDFHRDMEAHSPGWVAPVGYDSEQARADAIVEFSMLRESLALPLIEAVNAICTPATYQMGESVATGMHDVLKSNPMLRYAIAGHTHMARIDPVSGGIQSYMNTASWTTRLALPAPGEVTPELVAWLRAPDWQHIPLRDVTQFTFGMINTTPEGLASASLCVWEGGAQGSYRVLA